MEAVKNFLLHKSASQKHGKSESPREPVVKSSFRDLPVYEVSYPNNEIKLQFIAPYDDDMKTRLTSYFPRGPINSRKASLRSTGLRPRSLSLQPGYPGDIEWNKGSNDVAFAMSISLYEKDAEKGVTVGDPIADCCAVICTGNYIVMVCADGCGWGDAARTAARIATLSMLRTLSKNVLLNDIYTSTDVFENLCKGMNAVQKELIESEGCGLTTLCATVIAPLKYFSNQEERWVICNVRVGDTATYRYCKPTKHLSILSHKFRLEERNMCDAGGCLGPVVGHQPDLANLQYSVSIADSNCTIFLATDGVGDNFNPYVTNQLTGSGMTCSDFEPHHALLHKVYCSCLNNDALGNSCDLKQMPRHKQLDITDTDLALHRLYCKCSKTSSQQELCPTLVDILSLKYFQQTISSYYEDVTVREFVISICRMLTESTDRKRTAMSRYKERLMSLNPEETSLVNKHHRKYVKTIPGKLDHASLVAVNLGKMRTLDSYSLRSTENTTKEVSFTHRRNISLQKLRLRTSSNRSAGGSPRATRSPRGSPRAGSRETRSLSSPRGSLGSIFAEPDS